MPWLWRTPYTAFPWFHHSLLLMEVPTRAQVNEKSGLKKDAILFYEQVRGRRFLMGVLSMMYTAMLMPRDCDSKHCSFPALFFFSK